MHIPTSVAITLALLSKRQAFETYDSCAQTCFTQYLSVASQCDETVTSQAIACICGNTFYDDVSAACIFSECGATILNQTAQKHEYNCNLNGSPPALNAQEFYAAGNPDGESSGDNVYSSILSSYSSVVAAATGSVTAATTSTSSPVSSSSASSSDGGGNTLSTGALVGSIVGSIAGAVGSFAGVYFAYKTYKIKKEEKAEKAAAEAQGQTVGE